LSRAAPGPRDGQLLLRGTSTTNTLPISTTIYVGSAGVFEQDGAGVPIEFAYANHAEGRTKYSGANGTNYSYFMDHLGSTRLVLTDDGEDIVEATAYQAYGTVDELQPPAGDQPKVREKFTGKEFDEEGDENGAEGIRLAYFGARYYDAEVGYWVSHDPCMQFWSPYAYTGNGISPVVGVDPDGRDVAVATRSVLGSRYEHMVLTVYNRAAGAPDVTYSWIRLPIGFMRSVFSIFGKDQDTYMLFLRDHPADRIALSKPKSKYVISQGDPAFDELVVHRAAQQGLSEERYPWDAGVFLTGRINSNSELVRFVLEELNYWLYPDVFLPRAPAPGFTPATSPGPNGNVTVDMDSYRANNSPRDVDY